MTIEQENFAVKLTSSTEDHHSWLAVVRFGMGTLIQNQPVLAEILVAEAMKIAAKTEIGLNQMRHMLHSGGGIGGKV